MAGPIQDAMRCPEFESLMAEALDGLLAESEFVRFQQHQGECPYCGPLFAEAKTGRNLLRSLEELTPPAGMVEQILAATSGFAANENLLQQPRSLWGRVRGLAGRGGFAARGWNSLAPLLQPRFAMSFAMAFFSVTMLMNVFGLQVGNLQVSDLRPANFVRAYEQTTGRLVRYYENLRIVYEIQSRVEELRQSTRDTDSTPPDTEVEPAPPTGGLEPGASPARVPYGHQAWLLDSEAIFLSEEASHSGFEPVVMPDVAGHTNSNSARSPL